MSCLCNLEINPLSVALSSILRVILILFMVSFAGQKLLSLISFYLLIFVYISINLGAGSERILL